MAIRIDRAPVTRATQRERPSLGGVAIKERSGAGPTVGGNLPPQSRMLLSHHRREMLQVVGSGMGVAQDGFEVVTALIQGA